MPDRMEMDPNLVGSSRINLAKNQSPLACFLDDLEPGVSRSAAVDDGHFLAMHWMTADRLDNFASRFRESAGAQRQVEFLNFSSGKLVAQPQMREVMFGDHKTAAGFLVEPMDHSRPKNTPDAAQVCYVMQQRVDEGAGLDARSGMDRHSGRFIDDQQMFILE